MQHTLVAVFDNRNDATNAMNELLSSNFSRQDVQLSNADPTGMTDSVTGQTDVRSDDSGEGIGAGFKKLFSDLFGADNSVHASRYEGAVTRGHHVLTVTADSLNEVERAADIVERYGPTDIDEQASGAGAMGAGGMAAGMPMGASSGMQQSPNMSLQSGSGPGSNQQLDNPGDRKLFQQQSLNQAEPMGTTYQEPMGKSGLSATGGTSLHASTLQENAVQSSSLDGTQQTGTSIYSSGQQGGTLQNASLQGSSLEGSVQRSSSSTMQRDTLSNSDTSLNLGSQQRDTALHTATAQPGEARTIPVLEERLDVGKREVQRGGVRIYSRVVETPVNESIGLREEHVDVQRRTVDQPISSADATAFKEQSIEMRETSEEAVVEKTARIVEEVSIGKEVSQREQKITDTLRHTEVDVQRLDATSSLSDDDSHFRQHFSTTYGADAGSYDDYAPAYSYGSQMARSEMYRNRPWDDVEGSLRTDWDTRYGSGGQSTWEKMKSAVRHGWDRVTS